MAFSELTQLRTRRGKDYQDGNTRALDRLLIPVHYESSLGSGSYDTPIDLTPQRITAGGNDGWRVTANNWHYFLGQPNPLATDGWAGFGGRKGEKWLIFRLLQAGFLLWPTREWWDISGNPTYNRANLSQNTSSITMPTSGASLPLVTGATWADLWPSLPSGQVDVAWSATGGKLKEEVRIDQAARDWIAANRNPLTHWPGSQLSDIYFGVVFRLGSSDGTNAVLNLSQLAKWYKGGVLQDTEGDFDDDNGGSGIEVKNALEQLLFFLPVDKAFVRDADGLPVLDGSGNEITVSLRKRIYKDGSNYFLVLGARADLLNGMPSGTLCFDPTLDDQVAAGADDANERDDGTAFTSSSVNVSCDSNTSAGSRVNGGMRFTGVTIAVGSTITTAYCPIHAQTTATDDPNVDIHCEDVDDAADFSTTADVTSRARTTANTQWTATGIGTGEVNSPSFASALQEVIDRAGWASGNDIVVLFDGRSDVNQTFRIDSFDGSSTDCAKFHAEWTEPAAGRTTKNTDPRPLGIFAGVSRRVNVP